ncbi:MAG: hypothetical protein R3189_07695 [Thiomicrorhabdus chilensis]|uniref:hypothetical protein n=1 Tax=Thiomicrorhabdus chilensis TaxID=63656 RepID=UPI000427B9EF|nr:hypothetical protein [Thiomicrorhabdus chilensis]MDX1348118.1 hypothetical protein [Thiomicrorhabdus chilensis]
MVQGYDDLYEVVQSAIENYMEQEDAVEIAFEKNDNHSCSMINKQNRKKFVLMFAKYGDEYKVGFAFYEPDEYGAVKSPSWIEDLFNYDFDANFVQHLITEHLV